MSKNPMDYSHDIVESMRDTPLHIRGVVWGVDTFIEKFFSNNGLRARRKAVNQFKLRTIQVLGAAIQTNLKDPLDMQLEDIIWVEGNKQYRKKK